MFIVLHTPFDAGLGVLSDAHVALVYQGRNTRVLVQSSARSEEVQKVNERWLQAVSQELNNPPSLEFVRLMIRSIKITCQYNEHARQRYFQSQRVNSHRADFGRLDFERPGQGGTGVDGYW